MLRVAAKVYSCNPQLQGSCSNKFQHVPTRSNTFQHVPTRSNTFQHVPTRSNTLIVHVLTLLKLQLPTFKWPSARLRVLSGQIPREWQEVVASEPLFTSLYQIFPPEQRIHRNRWHTCDFQLTIPWSYAFHSNSSIRLQSVQNRVILCLPRPSMPEKSGIQEWGRLSTIVGGLLWPSAP